MNPRHCTAQRTESSPRLDGDCYDITLLTAITPTWQLSDWELRSNDLTVFVPGPKLDESWETWVYPRTEATDLPSYQHSDPMQRYWPSPSAWSLYGGRRLPNGATLVMDWLFDPFEKVVP